MISSHNHSDCLIVGGGIIGLSIAYELAVRGLSVQLLDQTAIGRAASWAGAGILPACPTREAADPLDLLRSFSHDLHAKWAEDLRKLTGIDTGYQRCGGIYLARSAAESATLAAQSSWWDEHGIAAESCTTEQLLRREPSLGPLVEKSGVRAAWYLPNECQLRNPRHLKALAAACAILGVGLHEHTAVDRIESTGPGYLAAVAGNQIFEASQACICSGAWSRLLLERMAISTGIMPIRGQMVLYNSTQPLLNHILNDGHRYLVARNDGRLLAGSCEEEVGYDTSTTPEMLQQLRDWAETILPQLKQAAVERTWAGLRAGSFDGMPYIGPLQSCERLFIAAGHFRAGLHMSCATAVVIADLMQGKRPSLDISAFRIGRG